MVTQINFVDGVAQNAATPHTFEIPSQDEKLAIKSGDFIKIGVKTNLGAGFPDAERFWIKVVSNDTAGQTITGRIDNDLVCTPGHKLKYRDIIQAPYTAILATE